MPESSSTYICSGQQHIAYKLALALSTVCLECTTASSRTKGGCLASGTSYYQQAALGLGTMLMDRVDFTC